MGKLLKTYLMPHPPIMVHEVGRGNEREVENTINSALEVAEEISKLKPDTIVILVPPHGPAFSDAMSINIDKSIKGDLGNFGAFNVNFEYEIDIDISNRIIRKSAENNIPIVPIDEDVAKSYRISNEMDHGSMVPLYFVNKKYSSYKLVHITYGLLSKEDLYHFGRLIREAIEESDKNAVFISSGDLSHRLTYDAPAGFNPLGKTFDDTIVELLRKPLPKEILSMDRKTIEAAGECGYRSIVVMMGVLDGFDVDGKVLSYEGPFGVGYCIASYEILSKNKEKENVELLYQQKRERISKIREHEDKYVRLARESLEYYIKHGKRMQVPTNLSGEIVDKKAGVFVSIKKDGELRGCIGTIYPTKESIAEEIIQNAISAGVEDPRFYPVEEDELSDLEYSVDVLGDTELVISKSELDPKRYGVIVRKGRRSGLLLPNLEEIDTVEEQLKIALRKANIREDEDYSIERFEVIRHK